MYNVIKPIPKKTKGLSYTIKMLCYKQLIRPVIPYGFPAWTNISPPQMERLRMFERKCIRSCVESRRKPDHYKYIHNTDLYAQGNLERIETYMIRLCLNTFHKWPDSPPFNDCLQQSIEYLDDTRFKNKPPSYILHLAINDRLYNGSTPILYH